MIAKNVAKLMLRAPQSVVIPKRNWAQVGHVVSTPPRVRVAAGEKILHGVFMVVFWLTPMAWFSTQLKVWRRKYIES